MCTVSWSVERDVVTLCFNRDERKTRPRARPPEELVIEGVRCLAPIDPVGGGTWLAVNEYGLCSFLLNNYAASAEVGADGLSSVSRGNLPLGAAALGDGSAAAEWLRRQELRVYRPFHLGLISDGRSQLFTWDGVRLSQLPESLRFFTSSSYRSADVETYRRDKFESMFGGQGGITAEQRRSYHLDLSHPEAAFNSWMRRADSETHCLSLLVVTSDIARFTYEEIDAETGGLLPPKARTLILR